MTHYHATKVIWYKLNPFKPNEIKRENITEILSNRISQPPC